MGDDVSDSLSKNVLEDLRAYMGKNSEDRARMLDNIIQLVSNLGDIIKPPSSSSNDVDIQTWVELNKMELDYAKYLLHLIENLEKISAQLFFDIPGEASLLQEMLQNEPIPQQYFEFQRKDDHIQMRFKTSLDKTPESAFKLVAKLQNPLHPDSLWSDALCRVVKCDLTQQARKLVAINMIGKNSNTVKALGALSTYIQKRREEYREFNGDEYQVSKKFKNDFNRICHRYSSATNKINAAQKCYSLLLGVSPVFFSKNEIKALHNSRLGSIYKQYKDVIPPIHEKIEISLSSARKYKM